MKDTIFISHAYTKESNYIAGWLGSKLSLLGYKVWYDLKDLGGGDSLMLDIQKVLKNDCVRFLAILNNDYIQRSEVPKSGVRKELVCADDIRDIKNYIIPLRFGDIRKDNIPIELREFLYIDFQNNWNKGLIELIEQFKKYEVPQKNDLSINYLSRWYEAIGATPSITDEETTYLTNWFKFKLPLSIKIYEPLSYSDNILEKSKYPAIVENNRIISFLDEKSAKIAFGAELITEVSLEEFIKEPFYKIHKHWTIVEPRKKIIKLLNVVFTKFLVDNENLNEYSLSSRKSAFFFSNNIKERVSLKEIGKTNASIMGKFKGCKWHFAISPKVSLHPFPHYKVSYHVLFSEIENGSLLNKDEQHEKRRAISVNWYNKEWRDKLLAFFIMLKKLNGDENGLNIPVSSKKSLNVEVIPYSMNINVSYAEPNE